jgi:hypothetical protein
LFDSEVLPADGGGPFFHGKTILQEFWPKGKRLFLPHPLSSCSNPIPFLPLPLGKGKGEELKKSPDWSGLLDAPSGITKGGAPLDAQIGGVNPRFLPLVFPST